MISNLKWVNGVTYYNRFVHHTHICVYKKESAGVCCVCACVRVWVGKRACAFG